MDIWGIQPNSQGKKQRKYRIFGGSNPPPKVEGDDCLGELQEVLIQTGADAEIRKDSNILVHQFGQISTFDLTKIEWNGYLLPVELDLVLPSPT